MLKISLMLLVGSNIFIHDAKLLAFNDAPEISSHDPPVRRSLLDPAFEILPRYQVWDIIIILFLSITTTLLFLHSLIALC